MQTIILHFLQVLAFFWLTLGATSLSIVTALIAISISGFSS